MNQHQKDLIKTLEIITTFNDQKNNLDFDGEYKGKPFSVTKEDLDKTNLDIYSFFSCCDELNKYGWAMMYPVPQKETAQLKKMHDKFLENPEEGVKNLLEGVKIQSKEFAENFSKATFSGLTEMLDEELITEKDLDDSQNSISPEDIKNLDMDAIAFGNVLPFKDPKYLLERLRKGENIEDVKVDMVMYNSDTFKLIVNDKGFDIKKKNDPPNIHYILKYIFNNKPYEKHYYSDMDDQTILGDKKPNRTYQDSCLKLQDDISKEYPELSDFLNITSTDVQISERYSKWIDDLGRKLGEIE